MAWTYYDNASGATVLTATQSSILGDMGGAFQDLPGCSLTLTQGTWLVSCHFFYRCWQTGTGYAKSRHGMGLTDSANNFINGLTYYADRDAWGEQRSDGFNTITTVIVVSSGNYVVKMRGASSMVSATNFASGFRWDSGVGGPSTMRAVRVGA